MVSLLYSFMVVCDLSFFILLISKNQLLGLRIFSYVCFFSHFINAFALFIIIYFLVLSLGSAAIFLTFLEEFLIWVLNNGF